MVVRIHRQENQTKAVLAGARTEMDLIRATTADLPGEGSSIAGERAK